MVVDEETNEREVLISSSAVVSESDRGLNLIAWSLVDESPYIALTRNPESGIENWTIVQKLDPVGDYKNVVAVIRTDATGSQRLLSRTSFDSLLILIVSLFVVLLLLVNHLRFFDYTNLYRKLKEIDQMKDDFLSAASYELRTPLAAIRGYADMALKHKADSERMTSDIEVIKQSAIRLNALVEDMLDVSRIEQKRMKLELVPLDLVEVIEEVVQEFLPQAQEKCLNLIHKNPGVKVVCLIDKNKTKQVFINLIGNAIKYSKKGDVEVSYRIEANKVTVIVKDSGIGMTAEQREKLFTKFYRVSTSETEGIAGTGLGLWITKQIVEMMNGKIFVDSMKDVGSQFYVTLSINDKG